MKKVYISGPISGYDLAELRRYFTRIADLISSHGGLLPICPLTNGLLEYAPNAFHVRTDLRLLLDCDAILMLEGWESSERASLEFEVAKACGIELLAIHRNADTGEIKIVMLYEQTQIR